VIKVVDKLRIKDAVLNMLNYNMGIREGEKVLVITDYPDREDWISLKSEILDEIASRSVLAKAVYEIGSEGFRGISFSFNTYPLTGIHGAEPPEYIADLMREADVVIAITTYSISHTDARERATKSGTRIASMPGFTEDMFMPGGPMAADYGWIKEASERIAKFLQGREEVKVTNDLGTEITLSVKGREWDIDTGIYMRPGDWGNLPGGEVYIAPLEGTASGVLVSPKGWFPNLEEDMRFYVREGYVYRVEGGGEVGNYFRRILGLEPRNDGREYVARRNIAELGIGTNPNAKRPDNVLEAEKILGTVHIAIGDNSHFGGKNPADLHEDFVQPRPTVIVDGDLFMDKGRITVL